MRSELGDSSSNELNPTCRHPDEFSCVLGRIYRSESEAVKIYKKARFSSHLFSFLLIAITLSLLNSTQNHHSFYNTPQTCTSPLSSSPLRPSSPLWQPLSLSPLLLRTVSPRWSSAPPLLALARTTATTTPSGTLVSLKPSCLEKNIRSRTCTDKQ
jgi:hypothetical protein